ncbi:hypothetical protein WJX81_002529 [Elliptochloris bilobata]|uniref:CYTH domain-containing protein n=1 Tax=Elliptochloris bilobata TaxID=381761 RepID=A0AAW1RWJ0_9CHLO
MEVEIKLRLADRAAHARVAEALRRAFRETHRQENFFFDGARRELSLRRCVMRCRFYNTNKRALLTVKGQQVLKDGIGRGTEEEEDLDPIAARQFLTAPSQLLQLDSPLVQKVRRETGVEELVCLGGFHNVRSDFDWAGFKLELDETQYEWGTVYEIEVETPEPEELKTKLEAFLNEHGVAYKYNTTTKFANFINRSLV